MNTRAVSSDAKNQVKVSPPAEPEGNRVVCPSSVAEEGERLALPELSEEERETLARMSDFMGRRY